MDIKVFIAGSGGIGQAAGLILAESKSVDVELFLGDISQNALDTASDFIKEGSTKNTSIESVLMPKEGANDALLSALNKCDVILDCLPGSQAPRLAKMAIDTNCHYANLTEYVAETNEIMEMAKGANKGFALQTGLAPGFINVLACRLYEDFKSLYNSDMLDEMTMKVGALSDHAPSPHFYAFTWSPIGVATEYIKDALVVKDFKTSNIPSLSGAEKIIIDGEMYEDNFTSGGAADLPQAFDGKVKNLHYKTLRHPGHYDWVKSVISGLEDNVTKIKTLEETMLSQIGSVESDNVVIYASVQGKDENGRLRRLEKSYKIYPSKVGNKTLRAIQTTTAAPLVEMAVMMVKGDMQGVILQSQVPCTEFMEGEFVKAVYGKY
jgi:saccharopine dehydrogenase-like NADP-dependent oxidoreductase